MLAEESSWINLPSEIVTFIYAGDFHPFIRVIGEHSIKLSKVFLQHESEKVIHDEYPAHDHCRPISACFKARDRFVQELLGWSWRDLGFERAKFNTRLYYGRSCTNALREDLAVVAVKSVSTGLLNQFGGWRGLLPTIGNWYLRVVRDHRQGSNYLPHVR
jgi:hypothetical protein